MIFRYTGQQVGRIPLTSAEANAVIAGILRGEEVFLEHTFANGSHLEKRLKRVEDRPLGRGVKRRSNEPSGTGRHVPIRGITGRSHAPNTRSPTGTGRHSMSQSGRAETRWWRLWPLQIAGATRS